MPAPGQQPRLSPYDAGMPFGAPMMPPAGAAAKDQSSMQAQAGVPGAGMPTTTIVSTAVPRSQSAGVPNPQPYATSGAMTAAPTAQYRPYAQPEMQYAGYGGGHGGGGYGDYGGSAGAGVPMPTVQYGSYAQPQMQYAGYGGGVGVPSSVPAQQAPIIINTSSRRRHHHHHGHRRRSRSYSHGRHQY
ncbi:hypothetical protein D9757_011354 [Collybiopsis confluens]|uniref:Uncharacterized protein n=1 Tax=Collybiopsis confluens TaxID=2823264 RepID=A0A8H5LLA1_9AGAR|nr:hypothetical protein D9757_011354 [Collybiopsis confluens]